MNNPHIETDYSAFELDALNRVRDIFDHRAMALDEGIASELFENELQSHVAMCLSNARRLFPQFYNRFDLALGDQINNCHWRGMITSEEYDTVQERLRSEFLDPDFAEANELALESQHES